MSMRRSDLYMLDSTVIQEICGFLQCPMDGVKCLGGYNNNVYKVNLDNPMVVKILDRALISQEQLISEVEWVLHLSQHNMSVVRPIEVKGTYVNDISNGLCFLVYEKAKGRHIQSRDSEVWNPQLFRQWGHAMGTLHALAVGFNPKHSRGQWHEHEIYHRDLGLLNLTLQEHWKEYHVHMHTLSATDKEFGLIHGDLHQHNLLLDPQHQLTVLDFGDSEYNWFAYDAAVAIYHAVHSVEAGESRREFAKRFTGCFMEGYAQGKGDTSGMHLVDFFLDFRHLYSYVYHTLFSDIDKLTDQQRIYLENMRVSLVRDSSFLGSGCKVFLA
ncbi:Putative homoserine kinase type II (protein kinase fold) [Paenibacillus uliginis N3/975]|uniref:Putative homoserine kinase type II (Protein kinase fold) n=2 Tax=Paenibacillus TaxID=44249 RepID=A0A1X7HBY7_9BACL|nr:Putative homoserine kinase type II (protein kinase fold) [Paenibacillus uliginis N3/975]